MPPKRCVAAELTATPTPDVTFHKRMTEGKRLLAARSPLSRLLPAAGTKRARSPSEGQPLDADPTEGKRARVGEDREALRAARRERKRAKKAAAAADAEDDGVDPGVGVVYVGHLPHGFYENELRSFFAQFGTVRRLRVSRSRKTARSKGFAFVEFGNAEVAKIAAEAMDGYLMFGRSLVAKVVDGARVHPRSFEGAGRKFRRIPWGAVERRRNLLAARDPKKLSKRTKSAKSSYEKSVCRLKELGIDYKFPSVS